MALEYQNLFTTVQSVSPAYAGVPLRVGGQIVGSLCVADHSPRAWQPALIEQLQQLAKLHEQGILTDEEFAAKKQQILGI